MSKRIYTLCTLTSIAICSQPVFAEPNYKVPTQFNQFEYEISGVNLEDFKREMNEKGPDGGKWAHTWSSVEWTPECEITLEIKLTLPKLIAGNHTKKHARIFANMLTALKAHQMQHVFMATYSAEELKRTRCSHPEETISYWKQKEIGLDYRTGWGISEGVTLFDNN